MLSLIKYEKQTKKSFSRALVFYLFKKIKFKIFKIETIVLLF